MTCPEKEQLLITALEESQSLFAAMLHENRSKSEIEEQMVQNRKIIEASRCATAVPVPQGWKLVPVTPTMQMVSAGDQKAVRVTWLHGKADAVPAVYHAMLAAAPQPPKVVPIQLPEPECTVVFSGYDPSDEISHCLPVGTELYTKQQVRDILAQYGIN